MKKTLLFICAILVLVFVGSIEIFAQSASQGDMRIQVKELAKEMAIDYYTGVLKREQEINGFAFYFDTNKSLVFLTYDAQSTEGVTTNFDQEDVLVKWNVLNWMSTRKADLSSDQLSGRMYKVLRDFKKTEKNFNQEVFRQLSNALSELRNEGFFKNTSSDFVLLVHASDADLRSESKSSLSQLLSAENFKSYMAWSEEF